MRAVTSRTKRAGVMGWPVGHSLSPRIHGYWLDRYGIDGRYDLLPVPPEDLESRVKSLAADGLVGANVTVPHKEAALRAADSADANARRVGAANTLVVGADGKVAASNTDGFGFLENLRAGAPDWRASSGPAVILGAGGAARAVAAALLDAGAPRLILLNRTRERADVLAKDLGKITVVSWSERERILADAALLVNATTLGMTGQPDLSLDLGRLPKTALVNDIVYRPLVTPLLASARARGNRTVDGLGMLLHQARPGFEAWFGVRPEVTEDLRRRVLDGLVGMEGTAED